jgi:lipid A disaccharide synthetase
VFYKLNLLLYFTLAKWMVATKFFTLPNVLAHRRIVPELVPLMGGASEIIAAAKRLIDSPDEARRQREDLARIAGLFKGRNAAAAAADAVEEMAGLVARHAAPASPAKA